MIRAHGWIAILAAVTVGCAPDVDESTLPSVPAVNVAAYQPAVREHLEADQRLFDDKPLHAGANGNLGMAYRAYRDFDAAEALFARARALAPRSADWAYYHGEVLEQKADYANALEAIKVFLKREPNDIPGRLRVARLHTALNQIDEALKSLEPLYAQAVRVGDVHVAYAQALTRAGRHAEATTIWEGAVERFGNFKVANYALAQLYRRAGDEAAAERQLWLFNTVGVEEPPAFDPRLAALLSQNRSDRALVIAAQAAKRDGDSARALELLEKALERFPGNMETRASLVLGYAAESNFELAERHIAAALALDDEHVELGLAIARVRLQQGRLGEAKQRLENVTQRSPKHAASRAWLARTYELSSDQTVAGKMYAQAFAIDPQQTTARGFYARWLIANAAPDVAEKALSDMVRSPARDEPRILSALAQVQVRLHRFDEALDTLSRAIERAQWQQQTKLVGQLKNQRAGVVRQAP